MSALASINETQLRSDIIRGVVDAFSTMLGWKPKCLPQAEVADAVKQSLADALRLQIVGLVGFAGEINGLVSLHFDLAFARLCARQLLGMTDAELAAAGDDAINDAIGELTTVTAGGFKNRFCDPRSRCELTVPSIVCGSNFIIDPVGSAPRHTFVFQCGKHRFIAEVLIQDDN